MIWYDYEMINKIIEFERNRLLISGKETETDLELTYLIENIYASIISWNEDSLLYSINIAFRHFSKNSWNKEYLHKLIYELRLLIKQEKIKYLWDRSALYIKQVSHYPDIQKDIAYLNESFRKCNDSKIVNILKLTESNTLLVYLTFTEEEIKNRILDNFSKRLKEQIGQDLNLIVFWEANEYEVNFDAIRSAISSLKNIFL